VIYRAIFDAMPTGSGYVRQEFPSQGEAESWFSSWSKNAKTTIKTVFPDPDPVRLPFLMP